MERFWERSAFFKRTVANVITRSGARVLLVSSNRERQPYPVVPNGLACVASALDAAGHTVEFTDKEADLAPKDGIFALQLHAGKPMWAEFKDVRLKRFTP